MTNPVVHNNDLTQAAIEYVQRFEEIRGIAPRFTIHYEGFGMGGTAGVTAEYAIRYLRNLAAADDPHYRYGAKIKSLEVGVQYSGFSLT